MVRFRFSFVFRVLFVFLVSFVVLVLFLGDLVIFLERERFLFSLVLVGEFLREGYCRVWFGFYFF